jgi:hypothetical protein
LNAHPVTKDGKTICECNLGFAPGNNGDCTPLKCPANADFDRLSSSCKCIPGFGPSPDGSRCEFISQGEALTFKSIKSGGAKAAGEMTADDLLAAKGGTNTTGEISIEGEPKWPEKEFGEFSCRGRNCLSLNAEDSQGDARPVDWSSTMLSLSPVMLICIALGADAMGLSSTVGIANILTSFSPVPIAIVLAKLTLVVLAVFCVVLSARGALVVLVNDLFSDTDALIVVGSISSAFFSLILYAVAKYNRYACVGVKAHGGCGFYCTCHCMGSFNEATGWKVDREVRVASTKSDGFVISKHISKGAANKAKKSKATARRVEENAAAVLKAAKEKDAEAKAKKEAEEKAAAEAKAKKEAQEKAAAEAKAKKEAQEKAAAAAELAQTQAEEEAAAGAAAEEAAIEEEAPAIEEEAAPTPVPEEAPAPAPVPAPEEEAGPVSVQEAAAPAPSEEPAPAPAPAPEEAASAPEAEDEAAVAPADAADY